MKYGLCLPIRRDCSIEFNIELAKRAEELGFDSVWVSDHVIMPRKMAGSFSTIFYDPFILLSAIASVTEKIMLGTSVIILPYRNPVVTAKMAATLDVLSGGRLIMGVAPGWLKEEFDTLGADLKNRGEITNEYIEVIKELWSNEFPEFSGKYVSFSDISFFPKPFNGRMPEIWVGGGSGPAKRRAVELANGWQPTWISPDDYSAALKELKKTADEKGKDIGEMTFSVRNRVRLEEPGRTYDTGSDPAYMFRGSIEDINEQVESFSNSGVEYIVFDPESESDGETMKLIESISESIIHRSR